MELLENDYSIESEPYFDEDMKRAPWYPISDFFALVKKDQIGNLEKEFGFNLSDGVEGFIVDILKKNFKIEG